MTMKTIPDEDSRSWPDATPEAQPAPDVPPSRPPADRAALARQKAQAEADLQAAQREAGEVSQANGAEVSRLEVVIRRLQREVTAARGRVEAARVQATFLADRLKRDPQPVLDAFLQLLDAEDNRVCASAAGASQKNVNYVNRLRAVRAEVEGFRARHVLDQAARLLTLAKELSLQWPPPVPRPEKEQPR